MTWVKMDTGSKMPVNADPVPNGNIILEGDEVKTGRVLKAPEQWVGPLYVSHFAVCPDAHKWRGKKR